MVSLVFGIIVKEESQLLLLMLKNLIMIQYTMFIGLLLVKLVLNVFHHQQMVKYYGGIKIMLMMLL